MATEAQCGECGETNPSNSAFCLSCGKYLGWEKPGPEPEPDPDPDPDPEPAPGPGAREAAPADGARGTTSPRLLAQGLHEPAATTEIPAVPPPGCPACGYAIEPGRRFCGRCGFVLVSTEVTPPPRTRQQAGRGWSLWGDPADRAARRAYRRTLPWLYRWRRRIVALVLAFVLGGLVAGVQEHPIAWLKERWRDLTADSKVIPGVEATALPPGSVAQQYEADNVVDGDDVTAWATSWPEDQSKAQDCGGAPGIGRLTLTWPVATRVDEIEIFAGRSTDDRANQFVPSRIDIGIDGQCVQFELDNEADWQETELSVDSKVREVTVGVAEVYTNEAQPLHPLVAISGIRVLTKGE